jgi:hypothetical protein
MHQAPAQCVSLFLMSLIFRRESDPVDGNKKKTAGGCKMTGGRNKKFILTYDKHFMTLLNSLTTFKDLQYTEFIVNQHLALNHFLRLSKIFWIFNRENF